MDEYSSLSTWSNVHGRIEEIYTANDPSPHLAGAFPASRHAQLLGNV
jgi:hypothetical protein